MSLFADPDAASIPIHCVAKGAWPAAAERLEPGAAAFAAALGFEGKPGQQALLPGPGGRLGAVLYGVEPPGGAPPRSAGAGPARRRCCRRAPTASPSRGPRGRTSRPCPGCSSAIASRATGARRPRRRGSSRPPGSMRARLERIARGTALARNLVNTPANDMGPDALEAAALRPRAAPRRQRPHGRGDELLERDFPLIHAVGPGRAPAAAPRRPRLGRRPTRRR